MTGKSINDLPTPSLLLDVDILERNCARMAAHMAELGPRLRPHLKTAKSAEIGRIATTGQFGGITVSTLAEAEYFAEHGFTDAVYSVEIIPDRIPRIAALNARGMKVTVISDSLEMLKASAEAATSAGIVLPVLIEIDCGDARGGLQVEDDAVVELARLAHEHPALDLQGVMTHGGHSYACEDAAGCAAVAEDERRIIVRAADRVREAGLPCPVISAGSSPTATHAKDLTGVTEMRPGVYTFGDLSQSLISSCGIGDIAMSVLATVVAHNKAAGKILIDAGSLAISADHSAGKRAPHYGYGLLVRPGESAPIPNMCVAGLSQEHGHIKAGDGGAPDYDALPVGARVRVLPNHACITAAAHAHYNVVKDGEIIGKWDKARGW